MDWLQEKQSLISLLLQELDIESEYMYGTSSIPEGLYDLVVSYRFDDEKIIVNDALEIISLDK